jgi:hypothetical protein
MIVHEWTVKPGKKLFIAFLKKFGRKFKESVCGKYGPYELFEKRKVNLTSLPTAVVLDVLRHGFSNDTLWYPLAVYLGVLLIRTVSFAKTPRQLNFINVTCYNVSLYVVDFKCAPNFDEAQVRLTASEVPVGLALATLASVAIRSSDRQIGNGNRVASTRISAVLELEESSSTGPTFHVGGSNRRPDDALKNGSRAGNRKELWAK